MRSESSGPLKKPIRATAGPCGRNTALRSLAESQDGTRLRALSSAAMARPRLQSDFIIGLLRYEIQGWNKNRGASRPKSGVQSLDVGRNKGDAEGPVRQGKFVRLDEQGR